MDPISISTDPSWLLAGMTVAGEPLDPHHVSIGESIEHFTSVIQGAFQAVLGNTHEWPGVTITTTTPDNGSLLVRIAVHEVRRDPPTWIVLRPGAPFDKRFIRSGEWPGTPR
jgi:hypothetical protein